MGVNNLYQACPENVTDESVEEELVSERGHGHSCPTSLIHDERFRLEARTYIRQNAYIKGEPNLTLDVFVKLVLSKYNTRRWVHELGFARVHHQKGVYFDGHDREDVVCYRNEFLASLRRQSPRFSEWRETEKLPTSLSEL